VKKWYVYKDSTLVDVVKAYSADSAVRQARDQVMRFHCRCRHCRTRRVLKQHPDTYTVVPQCRVCSRRYFTRKNKLVVSTFVVDKWMQERTKKNRAMGCMCTGYKWPGMMTGAMHRRGSKQCWYRANGDQRAYGDADYFMDPDIERFDYESNTEILCPA
jgi:hypothetical protein